LPPEGFANESSGENRYSLSDSGRATVDALLTARSEQIADLLDDWAPETHPEIQRLIAELTRSLVAEAPGRELALQS
jgi:DNA-binding MarR family transcriptional regulator